MAVTTSAAPPGAAPPAAGGPRELFRLWDGLGTLLANGLLWVVLAAYLLPMVYMFVTSIKEDAQLLSGLAPLWPDASEAAFRAKRKSRLVHPCCMSNILSDRPLSVPATRHSMRTPPSGRLASAAFLTRLIRS